MTLRFDVAAAVVRADELTHAEFPIEQLATRKGTRFQVGFARMTMHLVPYFKDAALEPSSEGLVILAANEMALALPVEVLRQIYSDDVQISEPRVRLLQRDTVQEPIMWVRAAAPREYTETIIHDLISRSAQIQEVDWLAPAPVVRATAPLRELLGYPAALARLTQATGVLQMRLSNYAPERSGAG